MATETQLFSDMSVSAQTNFAELFEQVQAGTFDRSVRDLPGSFNKKVVKGREYWYWQVHDLTGAKRQVYLGPDDERLQKLVQQHGNGQPPQSADLASLAGACVALGCATVIPQHFEVINRMAEHGFFRAGGVLVGTHAFIAMGNTLGVRWASGWRTNDVDVAHAGKNVSLALAENAKADMHDAISSLEMGLLPLQTFGSAPGATYITAKKDLRVDLLTSVGRKKDVYLYEPLNVRLQPLKFMEFSLEQPIQTALISGEQVVLVNIPSPMRYALHKLVIMGEREEAFRIKIQKDAGQVAALVEYGMLRSAAALRVAAKDLMSRGPGWRKRAAEGLNFVAEYHPQIAKQFEAVLLQAAPAKAGKER
ncbi:nucleotidyltransferase domain-containing protein [Variovorax sp. J22R133]|uniref:nucleotidyltransferase domain-containing protein n=1 Tax=Variovorax brevis TaxID=3053503 RepID=UPI002575DB57|nr:nucleotidyltransferase domain-containing protein [Variovorax sp. J22R133]MDM0116961.1 nucleotidyltransferase domain-containing protein [Variovorax sp. J22R133]